jgi:membrane-associated protease RseP (regulator of RpoE activity)
LNEAQGPYRRGDGGVTFEPSWQVPPKKKEKRWINALLLGLTVLTTTAAGMQMGLSMQLALTPGGVRSGLVSLSDLGPGDLLIGLPFSLTLLTILGVHEMGHFLASRSWRVRASLPYFIPFPSMIGTLGAVIKIRSRIPNRRALIDIGAAGPLAGFVVAVAAVIVGLRLSPIVPVSTFADGGISLGNSILSGWLTDVVVGRVPEGYAIYDHPVFMAGWLGLFVTVLNLMPVGQFDGGHIVYAIFGRTAHTVISRGTIVVLGLFWALGPPYDWLTTMDLSAWIGSRWPGWLFWMFIAVLLGRRHPTPVDPYSKLDGPRRLIGYVSLAIFVLCFVPRPISLLPPQ